MRNFISMVSKEEFALIESDKDPSAASLATADRKLWKSELVASWDVKGIVISHENRAVKSLKFPASKPGYITCVVYLPKLVKVYIYIYIYIHT